MHSYGEASLLPPIPDRRLGSVLVFHFTICKRGKALSEERPVLNVRRTSWQGRARLFFLVTPLAACAVVGAQSVTNPFEAGLQGSMLRFSQPTFDELPFG